MKRTASPAASKLVRWFAILVLLGTYAPMLAAAPSTPPKYGGVLRVQMQDLITSMDPRQLHSAATQSAATRRVDSLIFERLARFDDHGAAQPALAVSWEHDAQLKRWQFALRQRVKFSDGSPLTPEAAALALQQLLGNSFDVSATSDSVVILADHSVPDLPAMLAAGDYFIFHPAEDGSLAGTGPFRVAQWPATAPAAKIILIANETCWAGRSFVDKIEITMAVDHQQQANAIAFGQAEIVELPASEVRRAAQRGVRTASSDPLELYALQLDTTRPSVQDVRIRQAISLSIDRASIADVILQRQAVVAGSLLPNWLSGYAHLFPIATDLARAKELLIATHRELSHPAPVVLIYDSGDEESRAVADRVAVNLKDVGIAVQVSAQPTAGKKIPADIRLVRRRITTPDLTMALTDILNSLGETAATMENPDQIYEAERAPIDAFRIIPLAHVSESYGLSPQVRDWMAPRWGGWRLEDVWLGVVPPSTGAAR